jgi:hypothetical protein
LSWWYLLCSHLKPPGLRLRAAHQNLIKLVSVGKEPQTFDWAHSTALTYPFSAYLPRILRLPHCIIHFSRPSGPSSRSLSSGLRSSLALHSAHYGGLNVKCSGDGFRGTLAYHKTPPSFNPGVSRFLPLLWSPKWASQFLLCHCLYFVAFDPRAVVP